ncbi:MAG: ATPase, T2SS/T4P/T4SS family [bacterium]|nr:ATPase, T2SS/T4P/T4SS family [bacterium]
MKNGGKKSKQKGYQPEKAVKFEAEKIIENALNLRATDVHIEPNEAFTLVRFRINGVLQKFEELPANFAPKLAKYFKFLGELDFSEKIFAQTATIPHGKTQIRISVTPTFLGEKTTLRLLSSKNRIRKLEEIGLWGENLRLVKQALRQPNGIIFTLGRGKNNTNFALLNELISSEKNIITVENRVEKAIANIHQTEVKARIGLDYYHATKAALNQNPDVILIDDLRDAKTAELIFDASSRGKLLIVSLPIHKTSDVIPYLEFLGVPSFMLATNILAIIAQNLIRTTSKNAIDFRKISKTESNVLLNEFEIAATKLNTLEKAARKEFGAKLRTSDNAILEIPQLKAGFEEIGFTSATAIFEVASLLDGKFGRDFKNLIAHLPNSAEIEDFLDENNFTKMKIDGLIKALQNQTTVKEVIYRTGY